MTRGEDREDQSCSLSGEQMSSKQQGYGSVSMIVSNSQYQKYIRAVWMQLNHVRSTKRVLFLAELRGPVVSVLGHC